MRLLLLELRLASNVAHGLATLNLYTFTRHARTAKAKGAMTVLIPAYTQEQPPFGGNVYG
ncbi:MAG: hypothetical protein OEW84_02815 [Aigarchaeota archaeon]|nr:hypothetical protein [Aigarchaeota archaeon]